MTPSNTYMDLTTIGQILAIVIPFCGLVGWLVKFVYNQKMEINAIKFNYLDRFSKLETKMQENTQEIMTKLTEVSTKIDERT